MATRRAIQDDEEMEALGRGDVSGACAIASSKRMKAEEERLLDALMSAHPDVMNVIANRILLLETARSFGGVLNPTIMELAFGKIHSSLALKPLAPPEPTPAEVAAAERKRLLGMSLGELRHEVQRTRPRFLCANERVSPEVEALKTRDDVLRLPAAQLRQLMRRAANVRRLNEILAGTI
jgi:hypothetical protein